jgi:transglutaminase-like putative cysteine protease
MTRTGWTVTAAVGLVLVATGLNLTRRWLLGADAEGPRAAAAWRITIVAEGQLPAGKASFNQFLPRDFRSQHIFAERFASKDLYHHASRKRAARRLAIWRRTAPDLSEPYPFRITYSFRALPGAYVDPPAAQSRPDDPSLAPPTRKHLVPGPGIESDRAEVSRLARTLTTPRWWTPVNPHKRAEVRWWGRQRKALAYDLFRYVAGLGDVEPNAEPSRLTLARPISAFRCLHDGAGDSGGKSRLLVALLRNRRLPARLVSGLILSRDNPHPRLHTWVEAWVDGRWVPMCPTHGHFGTETFPRNYLILTHNGADVFRPRNIPEQVHVTVQAPDSTAAIAAASSPGPPSLLRRLAQTVSLQGLRPGEQQVARFLLLLPLAALIVAVFRTIVGVPTFGTFSPALLGLAFLNLKALPWALGIFCVVVLVGWLMRHRLENFHLLQVPRATALLTLIISLLLVLLIVANRVGITVTSYVALFPLVILTNLVERFWTVEAEDGAVSSFKRLFGTMIVTVTVTLLLAPEAVGAWMFGNPETLLAVLAAALVLGRYTGYRLSELYRFRDLVQEAAATSPPPGGDGFTLPTDGAPDGKTPPEAGHPPSTAEEPPRRDGS